MSKATSLRVAQSRGQLSFTITAPPEPSALFEKPSTGPYVKGSDTSEAAAKAQEGKLSPRRRLVLDYFERVGADGSTCDEMEPILNLPHQSASPIMIWLTRAGFIADSGRRRMTRYGNPAAVFVRTGKPR